MEREVRESLMGGEGGNRRVNSFEGNSAILHHSCSTQVPLCLSQPFTFLLTTH